MRVTVLDRRFDHHSSHSGYRQLVVRQRDVAYLPSSIPARCPPWVIDRLVKSSGRIAYTSRSAGFELTAARHMLKHPRDLYHVIYGEDDYHYLARVAPVVRRLGGKLVASFHQPPRIFDLAVPNAARVLPRLDGIAVTTLQQRDHLAAFVDEARIHHTPLGVDTSFFAPDAVPPPPKFDFEVITVGIWQRDFVLLEQVIAALARAGAPIRFTIVSQPDAVERLECLPRTTVLTGISDEHLRELYWRADALLLPMVDGASSNTLLEGMACGLPVIVTDLPSVREYATPSDVRLIAPFEPAAAIAELELLMRDSALRDHLARRAREQATRHDVCKAAQRLTALYESVGRRRRRP